MKVHILGIAGTFMGSLAQIAKKLGFEVTGMDSNIYSPMDKQLKQADIECSDYNNVNMPKADVYIIGNSLSRGHKCVEYILNKGYYYTSGAHFLFDILLKDKWVIAISGTHGKTTTASIISWILEYAGLNPSFLIGGVANNFAISGRVTNSKYFVIEADEYDTAFFDKRSKFVHYRPKTLIINNLEFDHSDIFNSIEDIKLQFHHLIRTMPEKSLIICPDKDKNIDDVFNKGLWTPVKRIITNTELKQIGIGSSFSVINDKNENLGEVNWQLLGKHNMLNALSAIFAANHIGVGFDKSIKALRTFKGVKKRLELLHKIANTFIYDDFAHHPSAISLTLSGLRKKIGKQKITAVFELRSNTMKKGTLKDKLVHSFSDADKVLCFRSSEILWDIESCVKNTNIELKYSISNIVKSFSFDSKNHHIVIMSNGSFANIHNKIAQHLQKLASL